MAQVSPCQIALFKQVSKVSAKPLLSRHSGDLKHPRCCSKQAFGALRGFPGICFLCRTKGSVPGMVAASPELHGQPCSLVLSEMLGEGRQDRCCALSQSSMISRNVPGTEGRDTWVDAFLYLGHVRDRLEVVDQMLRVVSCGAGIHGAATPLEKDQLIEGLHRRATLKRNQAPLSQHLHLRSVSIPYTFLL